LKQSITPGSQFRLKWQRVETARSRPRFRSSKRKMKLKTRDNLIYLTVGLGIAALVTFDAFYADSRGQQMWLPSPFAFRATYTTLLMGYFVVKQTRKMKAAISQVLRYVLFASAVHLVIVFLFRQTIGRLSGMTFSALALLEMFLVVLLTVQVARYQRQPTQ
jgi:hypothetical protein